MHPSTAARLTDPLAVSSFPANLRPCLEEPVAQPVEHVTFNHGVSGSNPDGLTIGSTA